VPADPMFMCGMCHTVWDLICGKVRSHTPLFVYLDSCRHGGCDDRAWEYVGEDGKLKEDVPPPEFVPGMPRTEIHRSSRPGPYRKDDRPEPRRRRETVPATPVDADGWDTDW
jgi:hypothetical protein